MRIGSNGPRKTALEKGLRLSFFRKLNIKAPNELPGLESLDSYLYFIAIIIGRFRGV
jgi:hypothetical protein